MIQPPAPVYLGPPAHSTPGDNKPIKRVVIHSTVSPCEAGGARRIAAYFRTPAAGGSAHYVVDPAEVVQAAYDSVIAWHAPPNQHSLGVELCDTPSATDASRWREPNHQAMLQLAAELVAQLCLAYGVPIRFLGPIRLRLGLGGITTHALVSQVFRQSTHWDPGAWPRRAFMREVRAAADRLQAADQATVGRRRK